MFKFVFSAVICVAMCIPMAASAQDCGCCEPAPNPCVKTRKKLKLVDVQTEVCRLKRQCVTDQCGCTSNKLVRVKETVCRKKLTVEEVPVDPCRKGMLKRLRGRLGSVGCKPDCGCAAPAPAPAPCGCEAAPAPAPAPCGCGGGPVDMGVPVNMGSAPIDMGSVMQPTPAAPCCGG